MAKRALISVSDKTGIVAFAGRIVTVGWEIVSTGGTQKILEEAGIPVIPVERVTDFPSLFSGRVKTMHPKITGGILMRPDNADDVSEAKEHGIMPIDMVVVNLYPFEEASREMGGLGYGKLGENDTARLIELIDIGGPTLLRSAAKNHKYVTVVCDAADYDRVAEEIEMRGDTSAALRAELAAKAFLRTAMYDTAISRSLSEGKNTGVQLTNKQILRYGENPHQWGVFYEFAGHPRGWSVAQEEKPISYLNILDADAAWNLIREFTEPTAACIKHANPSGVGSADNIVSAFQRSYDADRISAFGVIIALNCPCPKDIVAAIIAQNIFVEVIVAPGFGTGSLELLKEKPKIRAIAMDNETGNASEAVMFRSALGGMLIQEEDTRVVTEQDLRCVTDCKPTTDQIRDLLFAWKVVKHAKSNAIVFAKDSVTTGIGCGQTSRIDSVFIAARRAGERTKGSVMASDAFFPFPDSVEEAAKHGISAIIQPGGSIRDSEVIAKSNALGIPMFLTGVRAFRH